MDGPNKKSAAPGEIPASVLRWFESKSVEELEAKDWQGRALYPHTLKRKKATSRGTTEDQVLLRVPTVPERAKAQVDACRWAAKLIGWKEPLPPTIDLCVQHLGRVDFANMQITSLVAACVRDVTEPHGQFSMAEELSSTYGIPSLAEVSDRLDELAELEDPRLPLLDDAIFQRLVHAVSEAGSVSPLGAIAGRERSSFIVSMASLLVSSRTSLSLPRPSETSTKEGKPPQPSTG